MKPRARLNNSRLAPHLLQTHHTRPAHLQTPLLFHLPRIERILQIELRDNSVEVPAEVWGLDHAHVSLDLFAGVVSGDEGFEEGDGEAEEGAEEEEVQEEAYSCYEEGVFERGRG